MKKAVPPTSWHAAGARWFALPAAFALVLAALLWAGDPRTASLVRNTLWLAGWTCAGSVPLGTALALLLARTDLPGRRAGWALVGLMLFMPLYLQAAAWMSGFGLQGWFPAVTGGPVLLDGWTGAVWIHAVAAVPWVTAIVGVALVRVEPELEEAALLDTGPLTVVARVTLPAVLPAVGLAAVWVAVQAAGEMTVTDLFAVRTYAEELYTRTAVGIEPGEGPLGVLPGAMLTALVVTGGLVLSARAAPQGGPLSVRTSRVFALGAWRWPLVALAVAVGLLLVGVPWGSLLLKAGIVVEQVGEARVRSWSAGKLAGMVLAAPGEHGREIGWSALIGGVSATLAVVAAVGLAWPARRGGVWAWPAWGATALSLAVPGPLMGLAAIAMLNRPELPLLAYLYDNSILPPVLVLALRALGPATLAAWHGLASVPAELLDAAAVDGAGPLRRLLGVVLPMRRRTLAVAWLVALAVTQADLAASILVVPPGVTTLAIHIFQLVHYGVEDQVAAICLALAAITAALAGGVAMLVRRPLRPSARPAGPSEVE